MIYHWGNLLWQATLDHMGTTTLAALLLVAVFLAVPLNRQAVWSEGCTISIEPQAVDRLFKPFFTGRKGGTGLGLFIARELCQLNRAILLYEPRGSDGSVFRIVFSDLQRWEG
jgi:C4-dicarboxylate-specific signal transduction histidine kinase